ncbi:ROK family protein [Microlunatus soli]|uniref:Sugar kinase of the NBD/HSP70 family, may contain an N-terminal HTH domain n=1 Tax=Microlunatus soli TaxID=630515 RepID=A0A1H1YP62_9ACTN|nr:ROK family protein [Microlunatus soli]SDT23039.1 Sugar kinase of the NBD/HSP70 family, may contain an N-terminal HTH domain [Microlunatus soli]
MNDAVVPRAGQDDVRRRNLSLVLRRVHQEQAISRAELTQLSGLSRSSIGTLVSDLEVAGIVAQQSPSTARGGSVGRPSPVVAPTDRLLSVAVNPDVTGVHVALVGLGGRIVAEEFVETSRAPAPYEAAEMTAAAVLRMHEDHPGQLVGLCAAIPGRVDKAGTTVKFAPHLQWTEVPFAAMLAETTHLRSTVAFDARLGLTAETLWGTARGTENVVYLYGGPGGIGGAAMVDGHILDGAVGAAARLGHTLVAPDGPTCVCGNVGCLTSVVGMHAFGAAYGIARPTVAALAEAIRTQQGAGLRTFLERQLHYLGTALRMAVWSYDPQLIMLGGFFATLLEVGEDRLAAAVAGANLGALREPPTLIAPILGQRQLLVGAGAAAMEPLLQDPIGLLQQPTQV